MGCFTVLLHVFLVLITNGWWLLVLAVWALLKIIGVV